jgi:gamma-glutamylcyclotransferase (GGCT)/AIG2-like uncharacterized protein YtfP
MEHLFAYGTLMCDDIMREVAGCSPVPLPGTLRGYRRCSVRDALYPALVPDEEGCVEGVVYRNVPPSAWDRLDRFEGEMYERRVVQIELMEGTALPAATYVVRPEFLDLLDPSDWDFAQFLRNGKASFERHYPGYRSLPSND